MGDTRDELSIDFGAHHGGEVYRTTGWSVAEPTETWTLGTESRLVLPVPERAGPYVLSMLLRPMLAPPQLRAQRLRVVANGAEVGNFTIAQRGQRCCVLPWELIAGRPNLEIALHMPDAARPADFGVHSDDRRELGVALERMLLFPEAEPPSGVAAQADAEALAAVDRMALHDLMLGFESLGQNCEFGLAQRQCQAEPLGLLRFSSTPLAQLLNALDNRFEGMGEPEAITVSLSANGREYMVNDRTYGFLYHAWVNVGEMTAADVAKREARRVPFLVRKLLEDLAAADKIFVFKGMSGMPEEEVFPLAMALRRYGPNTLLYVKLADASHSGGTVEQQRPGFLVGYIDRFAPGENAHDLLLDQWVAVCRAALRLRLAAGG